MEKHLTSKKRGPGLHLPKSRGEIEQAVAHDPKGSARGPRAYPETEMNGLPGMPKENGKKT